MTATAAEGSCTHHDCGPDATGDNAEVSGLAAALLEALSAAAQLAARYRAYAVASREPTAYARAAGVTGAAQALGQARELICGGAPRAGGSASPAGEPPEPVSAQDETAQLLAGAHLLEGAVSALARRSAAAARDVGQPLAGCLDSVHACLLAALQQLARARGPQAATTAGQEPANTGDLAGDPDIRRHEQGTPPDGCAT